MADKHSNDSKSFSLLDMAPELYTLPGTSRLNPATAAASGAGLGSSVNAFKTEGNIPPASDNSRNGNHNLNDNHVHSNGSSNPGGTGTPLISPAPPNMGKAPGKSKKKDNQSEIDYDTTALDSKFHRLIQQLGVKPSLETPLIIGVTSTLRGEGRTTVAMGLASAISQTLPHPVALLEADLSNQTLAQDFGIPSYGLSEYLRGEIELDELTRATKLPDLAIIAAGKSEGPSLDLLRSERLTKLLKILTSHFAAVVVDLPPMCQTGEANRVIGQVDKVVMVVESGSTPSNLVKSALELIPEQKLLGILLNRTKPAFGLARLFERLFG